MEELERKRLSEMKPIPEEELQKMEKQPQEVTEIESEDKVEDLEKEIEELEKEIEQEDEEDIDVRETIQNRAALMKLIPKPTKNLHPI